GAVAAGQEAGPARRADRRRREGVEEARPLAGDAVHVGRLDLAVAVGPDRPAALVVGDDGDDVVALRLAGPGRRLQAGSQGEGGEQEQPTAAVRHDRRPPCTAGGRGEPRDRARRGKRTIRGRNGTEVQALVSIIERNAARSALSGKRL